ncbi:hypothetical protein [Actinoplanes sp. NPDC051494]|uniref:hypothetical protein n=1 Tax=Actinoplanes sp. NPDC051494 TaxID=3363907 RepID=UPI0037AFF0FF
MDEEASLLRFGLTPAGADLDAVRAVLREQGELDPYYQDVALMKLGCVQLFNAGRVEDSLVVWAAKESGFDAHCSIDVQLLCGAGLEATKAYLAADGSQEAADALRYLGECEATGDFTGFTPEGITRQWQRYYRGEAI